MTVEDMAKVEAERRRQWLDARRDLTRMRDGRKPIGDWAKSKSKLQRLGVICPK